MSQSGSPADEPKDRRFNMFISESEMTAISDWAWANRIRSLSEAVRRLVQVGLAFDPDKATEQSRLLAKASADLATPQILIADLINAALQNDVNSANILDLKQKIDIALRDVFLDITSAMHVTWGQLHAFNDALKNTELQKTLDEISAKTPSDLDDDAPF